MSCMGLSKNQKNELLFVGFNQDYGCFACGTDNGFRIYNVDPFRETFRRVFSNGGVGIVEMLFRCNLLALVGGGRNPRYPPNKVMIWDDHQSRCIGELSFRSEVKAVRLRRDRVVVVLAQRIYVYRFSDLHLLDRINTIRNDAGLVALCADASNMVLACPGVNGGHVNVELYDLRRSTLIPAHESELGQLALSMDGKMVATASTRGTLLRVFDTDNGTLLHELRRGMDRAEITSICFNQASTFVACCSDRGTAHIFSLQGAGGGGGGGAGGDGGGAATTVAIHGAGGEGETGRRGSTKGSSRVGAGTMNALSGLRFVGGLMLPNYFNSEWSYAQIRGIESRTVCAFGREPDTVVLISEDGSFLTARFSEPGECERVSYARFLKQGEGDDDEDEDDEEDAMGSGRVHVGRGSGRGGGEGGALGQPSSAATPTSVSRKPDPMQNTPKSAPTPAPAPSRTPPTLPLQASPSPGTAREQTNGGAVTPTPKPSSDNSLPPMATTVSVLNTTQPLHPLVSPQKELNDVRQENAPSSMAEEGGGGAGNETALAMEPVPLMEAGVGLSAGDNAVTGPDETDKVAPDGGKTEMDTSAESLVRTTL